MNRTEDLVVKLTVLTGSLDDALTSLEAARRRADETVGTYAALGGSAERAQAVYDRVDEVHAQVQSLPDHAEEAQRALGEVDAGLTPVENLDKLQAVIELLDITAEATTAAVDACDEAETEIYEHLSGARVAEEIAGLVAEARDQLEQVRSGLDALTEDCRAQQEVYRGNVPAGQAPAPRLPRSRASATRLQRRRALVRSSTRCRPGRSSARPSASSWTNTAGPRVSASAPPATRPCWRIWPCPRAGSCPRPWSPTSRPRSPR